MDKTLALASAGLRSAMSYRVNALASVISVLVGVVPVYFVARALQPMMASSITGEGGQYFGFLIVGMVTLSFVAAAATALPTALSRSLSNGTLEALLATPTPPGVLLVGLASESFVWTVVRTAVLLAAGWCLGAGMAWGRIAPALLILLLIILAHVPFGLFASAMVLAFRTAGPLPQAVVLVSSLLGGVYYPTAVIPGWIQRISGVLPLTYGLRPLRQVLLDGASFGRVLPDVLILGGSSVVLLAAGAFAFAAALRYARRTGTLSHY